MQSCAPLHTYKVGYVLKTPSNCSTLEPVEAGGLRELCSDQESAQILARDVSCTHRATDAIGGSQKWHLGMVLHNTNSPFRERDEI